MATVTCRTQHPGTPKERCPQCCPSSGHRSLSTREPCPLPSPAGGAQCPQAMTLGPEGGGSWTGAPGLLVPAACCARGHRPRGRAGVGVFLKQVRSKLCPLLTPVSCVSLGETSLARLGFRVLFHKMGIMSSLLQGSQSCTVGCEGQCGGQATAGLGLDF